MSEDERVDGRPNTFQSREHALHRRRRGRNYAVLGVLLAFVALMFAVTIAKMGSHAGNPWG